LCIRIQPHSNREKKEWSHGRDKEKRKTDDGEKRKDEHPQRIPMTITRYPKCHLTINNIYVVIFTNEYLLKNLMNIY